MQENNFFGVNEDEEALILIKAQNKKINNLYEELNNREYIINQLEKENAMIAEYANENQDLKNRMRCMEKNLNILKVAQEEKERYIQTQLQSINELEKQFNIKLANKDNIISDKEQTIADLEFINKERKNENDVLLQKNNEHLSQIESLNSEIKNLNIKDDIVSDELTKLRSNLENKTNEAENIIKTYEEKILELVDLIKSQNNELNDFASRSNFMEKENKNLKEKFKVYEDEIDTLNQNLEGMNNNLHNQNLIIENMKKNEQYLLNLELQLNQERELNKQLTEEVNEISESFKNLKVKYSGENSLESLHSQIKNREEEIMNLEKDKEYLSNIIGEKDLQINEIENEIEKFIKYINNFLGTTLAWADTYLGVYTDKTLSHLTVPELKYKEFEFLRVSKYINDYIKHNFDGFCDTLNKIRLRLHNDLEYFNENLAKTNVENKSLIETFRNISEEYNAVKIQLEKALDQNKVDKNNLFNMRNDLKFFQDKIASLEKLSQQDDALYKNILSEVYKEYQILFEIIKSNNNFKSYVEYLEGFKIDPNTDILAQNILDTVRCLSEFAKITIKDLELSMKKAVGIADLKAECDELRKEFLGQNRMNKEIIDKTKTENLELKTNFEKIRNNEMAKTEASYTQKMESMRNQIKEKDEAIMRLTQDNTILKSQLVILEKNLNNLKINSKESDENLKQKIFELNDAIKNHEAANNAFKNEIELLKLKNENLENNLKKKAFDIDELKKQLKEYQDYHNSDKLFLSKFNSTVNNVNVSSTMNDPDLNNNLTKMLLKEKEENEKLNREIINLKSENNDLLETNLKLREQLAKNSENMINLYNTGQKNEDELIYNNEKNKKEREMEMLIKGYKDQLMIYEDELRQKDMKLKMYHNEAKNVELNCDQYQDISQKKFFKNDKRINSFSPNMTVNSSNKINLNSNNFNPEKSVKTQNNNYNVNDEKFESKNFLANLNCFINK